jgi:catechol 2,3-dioxygenase-like lactoylglutathione lyase family enzyme
MRARSNQCWGLLFVLVSLGACEDDSSQSATPITPPGAVAPVDGGPARTDAGPTAAFPSAVGTRMTDAGLPATGPSDAGQAPADAGSPDASSPVMGPADAGGQGPATPAASGPDGGASGAAAPDAGTAPAQVPTPVATAYVWGLGIGVSDLPAAVKYFTDVMKMSVEKDGIKRDDRTETVLVASQAMRGARLVLMHFDDNRPTQKITAKLVWQASDPGAVTSVAAKYPGYVSRVDILVSQFDGPDTYIQEVGSGFDSEGSSIRVPYPIALGYSVSDLAASRRFYTGLGMTESSTGTFPVTDATGSATITEYSMRWKTGSALVLQDWSPRRNSKNNPVKSVMFVPDAQAVADKIVAGGGTVAKPAARSSAYDNRLVIVAKDLDGYEIELVQ